jgi:hypothetical protein
MFSDHDEIKLEIKKREESLEYLQIFRNLITNGSKKSKSKLEYFELNENKNISYQNFQYASNV